MYERMHLVTLRGNKQLTEYCNLTRNEARRHELVLRTRHSKRLTGRTVESWVLGWLRLEETRAVRAWWFMSNESGIVSSFKPISGWMWNDEAMRKGAYTSELADSGDVRLTGHSIHSESFIRFTLDRIQR